MDIAKALEQHLVSSFENKEEKVGKKFYLSDTGKCLRMRFLKRKGIGIEFAPYVYWTLQMGNILHDYGYKVLEASGLLLEAEEYVNTEHFSGRFDGMVKADPESHNIHQPEISKSIFDFKSTGKWKLKKVIAGEEDEEYIKQLLSYVMLLQDSGRKEVSSTAYIVYLNKEPGDELPMAFFQKEVHLTSWRRKQLKEEMDNIVKYWLKDKVPPCTCPMWMKPYNAYLPLCQSKEAQVKEVLKYMKAGNKIVTTNQELYMINDKGKREVLKI
jgi:hypothetical protein